VSSSVQVWLPEQARRGEPQARLAKETALPWEQAQPAALQEEPLRAAVPAGWEPDAPRAVPEAAVSARAVAAPRPEAAMAASELQAEAAAAGAPDEPRAVVAAEAASDVTVRRPVAARREDAEVQPRAAVRPDVQVLLAAVQPAEAARPGGQRAAVPWALPSSGPVSCGWACATTSGGALCACDAELANCIAVRAVVASSTKRRLVMMVNFPGRFFDEVS
jgi:hypothetical protein